MNCLLFLCEHSGLPYEFFGSSHRKFLCFQTFGSYHLNIMLFLSFYDFIMGYFAPLFTEKYRHLMWRFYLQECFDRFITLKPLSVAELSHLNYLRIFALYIQELFNSTLFKADLFISSLELSYIITGFSLSTFLDVFF